MSPRDSFQATSREGKPNQSPAVSLSWDTEIRASKTSIIHNVEHQRRESCTEIKSFRDLQRVLLQSLAK